MISDCKTCLYGLGGIRGLLQYRLNNEVTLTSSSLFVSEAGHLCSQAAVVAGAMQLSFSCSCLLL